MNPGMAAPGAIELVNVTMRYRGGPVALRDASLSLGGGRIGALVGPNGSGKSTLLKLAAGLLSPTSGVVRVEGLDAVSVEARAKIGYLPESPQYPAGLKVDEFLRFAGKLSGGREGDLEAAVSRTLHWAGLAELRHRAAAALSTGERQRLGLAQALLHQPSVLLLDEPAAALDPSGVAALASLLERLRSEGRTVLLSSHFLPQVEAACDRVWLMHEGRIVWEGKPGLPGELEKRFVSAVAENVPGS